MTHAELVEKARAAGIRQCIGTTWKNRDGKNMVASAHQENADQVGECCEIGLLQWGVAKGYVTPLEITAMAARIMSKSNDKSVVRLNDVDLYTFDQFSELVDQQ